MSLQTSSEHSKCNYYYIIVERRYSLVTILSMICCVLLISVLAKLTVTPNSTHIMCKGNVTDLVMTSVHSLRQCALIFILEHTAIMT